MELVRILWIFIFLFFALILIFTWSKISIISGKIRNITGLMERIVETSNPDDGKAAASTAEEAPKPNNLNKQVRPKPV
jgi:hypothetical protein